MAPKPISIRLASIAAMALGLAGSQPGPAGACCLANGICQTKTEARCTTAGGNYQGDDSWLDLGRVAADSPLHPPPRADRR